jgi:O-antigen ligase
MPAIGPGVRGMAEAHAAAGEWPGAKALFRLEARLLGAAMFAAGAVPRLLPLLLGLLGLVAAVHVFISARARLLDYMRTPVFIALLVFLAYVFINATWSPDPGEGMAKAATTLGLSLAVAFLAASYALRNERDVRVLAVSALAGLLLGLGFLLIELLFDEPLARFVNNHIVQLFDVSPKKVRTVNGEVIKIAPFVLNRNVTSVVLLLIPCLLFTMALATARARRASLALLVAAAAAAVLLSQSGTSVVAFFAGGFALALAALSLKAIRLVLIAAWTAATLLAVPLGALPYALGWHHWTWLPPESVAARFYIWKYVADRVPEKPITGIGIRGTRALHLVIPTDAGDPSHDQFALKGRAARHPHNIYLQTWLELGAIGAVLLLALGLTALWQIRALAPPVEGSAYGLFAVSSMIGFSGFDLWQTWLLASAALGWAGIFLAARLPGADFLRGVQGGKDSRRKAVSSDPRA